MTYSTIADIAADPYILRRITAAAAQERKPRPYDQWAYNYRWDIASSPGWAEAWESAVAAGVSSPGNDPAVITDGMILSAVQPIEPPDITPPIVTGE